MFQERRQKVHEEQMRSARLMYTSALQLWRYAITARVILLATGTTTLGVFMSNLRAGITVGQVVEQTPLGPRIAFTKEPLGFELGMFLVLAMAVFVVIVLIAEITLSRIAQRCAVLGEELEVQLKVKQILTYVSQNSALISSVFVSGRILFVGVSLFWVLVVALRIGG